MATASVCPAIRSSHGEPHSQFLERLQQNLPLLQDMMTETVALPFLERPHSTIQNIADITREEHIRAKFNELGPVVQALTLLGTGASSNASFEPAISTIESLMGALCLSDQQTGSAAAPEHAPQTLHQIYSSSRPLLQYILEVLQTLAEAGSAVGATDPKTGPIALKLDALLSQWTEIEQLPCVEVHHLANKLGWPGRDSPAWVRKRRVCMCCCRTQRSRRSRN